MSQSLERLVSCRSAGGGSAHFWIAGDLAPSPLDYRREMPEAVRHLLSTAFSSSGANETPKLSDNLGLATAMAMCLKPTTTAQAPPGASDDARRKVLGRLWIFV